MSYPDDNIAWQHRFTMNGECEWVPRDESQEENRG